MEQITISARGGDSLRFKGDLLICDPCYFFSSDRHSVWSSLVDQMFRPGNESIRDGGIATIKGPDGEFSFIYTKTAYGDGTYELSDVSPGTKTEGSDIPVDAGLICAVLRVDAEGFDPEFVAAENGVVVLDFDGTIGIDPDEGTLFGEGNSRFAVLTGFGEEEDEWEEDEEDEEEYN